MKICLLFPPQWTPTMPHLALPWLTGILRQQGHTVLQRDLNIEVFDQILTRRHLRHSLERIRRRFDSGSLFRPDVPPAPTEQVRWALEKGPMLIEKVEKAKSTLRSPRFYDPETCLPAYLIVADALELNSLAHYPSHLDFTGFSDALRPDISSDLFRSASDPDLNPFLEIFQRGILPDLQRAKPDLIGISIPTQGQFLAAITLATLIRQAGLTCHITAGGPHVSMLREQIPNVPALFELFDSFVVFDGEVPIQRLAETVETNGDLASVPNLIYRSPSGEIRSNPHLPTAEVRIAQQNVRPDFDGLPLDRYLSPEPVLPLIAAHGCYHGKCAFCNVGYGDPLHYHPLPAEFIVEEMQRVKEKYGCRHIFLVDEAIPPRTLKRLGPVLEGQGISWAGAVRLEKALVPPLLESASAGGCRMMLFGLESASEPIMQAMIKGTDRAEMSRVLHDVAAAGIWAHTFFFFGFPGETLDDAQKTVNFVYEHQKVIHSASPGAFLLEIYAPAYYFPEKFGITKIHTDPRRDLAIYFDFDLASGLDETTANFLSDKLIEQLPDKRYGQYYVTDVYKFLYSSELHRQGKPLPPWIE
jgi:hypothetical protein